MTNLAAALALADDYNQQEPVEVKSLPVIVCNDRQDRDIIDDAMSALIDYIQRDPANPLLFISNGSLCKLVQDDESGLRIQELTPPAFRKLLSAVANWGEEWPTKKGGSVWVEKPVPERIATMILHNGEWPGVPVLSGIVFAPVFSEDGTLHDASGYSEKTKSFYASCVTLPKSEKFTVESAKALIFDELLFDFPFKDPASKAHSLALMLLPFMRNMIDGPTPLHLIDSPKEGTGKGKLLTAISSPFTGGRIKRIVLGEGNNPGEETGKQIVAALASRMSHIAIDNIPQNQKFDSAVLCSAITDRPFSKRFLGTNKDFTTIVKQIWCGTGNNVQPTSELARRILQIRIDANTENPFQRNGFKHSDIEAWARENRPRLILACLTIIQAWIDAGKPLYTGKHKGSFERWTRVMGGILQVAGVPGFLENDNDLREFANTSNAAWREFVLAWRAQYGAHPTTTKELFLLASHSDSTNEGADLLGDDLGSGKEASRRRILGHMLSERKDTVIAGCKIVQATAQNGYPRWALSIINPIEAEEGY